MIAEPVLTLAWLALAHLVADFVIQTNRIATDKFSPGPRAWRGLAAHWAGVAICLLPLPIVFGIPGAISAIVISSAHAIIDRAKVLATWRVEARAVSEALAAHEGPAPEASLGMAWTPLPAALFALDQLAHVVVIAATWAIWLAPAAPLPGVESAVATVMGNADPAVFHRVVLTVVVLVDLAIVNVRAGSLFVATLVHPREVVTGEAAAEPSPEPLDVDPAGAERSGAFTVRIGPFTARAEPTAQPLPGPVMQGPMPASTARVGATIGVLERLLIVAFVLTNASAADWSRHRGQDAGAVQAARRPPVRRVLPARHPGQRLGRRRQRPARCRRPRLIPGPAKASRRHGWRRSGQAKLGDDCRRAGATGRGSDG